MEPREVGKEHHQNSRALTVASATPNSDIVFRTRRIFSPEPYFFRDAV